MKWLKRLRLHFIDIPVLDILAAYLRCSTDGGNTVLQYHGIFLESTGIRRDLTCKLGNVISPPFPSVLFQENSVTTRASDGVEPISMPWSGQTKLGPLPVVTYMDAGYLRGEGTIKLGHGFINAVQTMFSRLRIAA